MWDWEDGELAYKKTIEINPNHAEAHGMYSMLLIILGRPESRPLSTYGKTTLGHPLIFLIFVKIMR